MVPSPPYSSVYLLGDFTMYLQYRSMRSFCRNRGTDYFSVVTVTVVIHGFEREVQPELRDAQNRDERLHVSITHLPFTVLTLLVLCTSTMTTNFISLVLASHIHADEIIAFRSPRTDTTAIVFQFSTKPPKAKVGADNSVTTPRIYQQAKESAINISGPSILQSPPYFTDTQLTSGFSTRSH